MIKHVALGLLLATRLFAEAEAPDVLAEPEAKARAARVSAVEYALTVGLAAGSNTYDGDATVTFTLADTAGDLYLDFKSAGVKSIALNGKPVDAKAATGTRIVLPKAALAKGKNVARVTYTNPFDLSGQGVHRFVDPEDARQYLYTDFEPFFAHRWFPCFDQPDLKARMRLDVVAPAAWKVVANMATEKVADEGGKKHHTFQPSQPISTYLMFMAAGDYLEVSDPKAKVPSRIFARHAMKPYLDTEALFEVMRTGLTYYPEFFRTPYPFPKYDQLYVPEFASGAMENPGCVTFNERYLYRHAPSTTEKMRRASVILHEMAHMWFGDLVTMRWWDGLWLNESFATYMACMAEDNATVLKGGFDNFLSGSKVSAYEADQRPTTHPVAGDVADTDTAFSSFDSITYSKGASLIKQLAFVVGTDAFRRGLADYFKAHAWGSTDISDFIGAIGHAAGKDLSGWAKALLSTAGVNSVTAKTEVAGGQVASVTIEQAKGNAAAIFRPQRLAIALYSDQGQEQKSAVVTLDGEHTPVPELNGAPAPAFVWPNLGDHAYLKVYLDDASLAWALANLDKLGDGLTRRGVWVTLWHMVRESKLAPVKYLESFRAKAPLEPDTTLIQALADPVRQALDHYVDDVDGKVRESVHQVARAGMAKALPQSDAQKAWFELAVDTATAPASQEAIESWLTPGKVASGFELGPDHRWRIVKRLCAVGYTKARALIAAESKKDRSDMGAKQALEAEASLPDPAVKAAMWKRIVEDRTSSGDLLHAAMKGFHRPGQAALSKPYIEKFAAAVPDLQARNDPEFLENFISTMFPDYVFEPATVAAMEKLLARPDLRPDAKKTLSDQMDEFKRAMEIRKAAGR